MFWWVALCLGLGMSGRSNFGDLVCCFGSFSLMFGVCGVGVCGLGCRLVVADLVCLR